MVIEELKRVQDRKDMSGKQDKKIKNKERPISLWMWGTQLNWPKVLRIPTIIFMIWKIPLAEMLITIINKWIVNSDEFSYLFNC